MTVGTWVSVIGVLSVLLSIYTGYDYWRKRQSTRSTDVVSSALQLLEPYKLEVAKLQTELSSARATIREMEQRSIKLSNQLFEAQREVSFLRIQVDIMRDRLPKEDSNGYEG